MSSLLRGRKFDFEGRVTLLVIVEREFGKKKSCLL